VMFCFAFLLLLFAGGGAYALDARRGRWRSAGAPRRTGWRTNRRLLRR
jgi:putative oxidoreductase